MKLPNGLPHLQGWRGTVVRGLFALVALLTLVQIVGSTWFNGRDMFVNIPAAMSYGFKTYTRATTPITGEVIGAEARRSGLPVGAEFVSIDGEPLPRDATEFTIGDRLAGDADGRIVLVMKVTDGHLSQHRLTYNPARWTMTEPRSGLPLWLYSGFMLASLQVPLLILFGVALVLVGRRPRDPEAMLIAFGLLLFCFTPGASFWLVAKAGVSGIVFQRCVVLGFLFSILALTGFPDGRFTGRLSKISATGIVLMLPLLFINAQPNGWGGLYILVSNLLVGMLAAMAIIAMVLRYRASTGGGERQQVKWAMLGFSAGITCLMIGLVGEVSGLLGQGRGTFSFILDTALFAVGPVLGPLGLLVSLLRYRLYDAESAMSRSFAYAGLTVALVSIFAGSEKLIELTSERYFGGQLGVVAGGLGAALVAVLIAPLHRRMNHWAEHRFQKNLIRLRRSLPLLVGDLRETATLPALAEAAIDRVMAGVPATGVAIFIDGATVAKRGNTEELPVAVPLAADGVGEVGQLRLGTRPDGSLYGKDEREALDEIADPLARAIAVVRQREAAAEARAAETRGLADRIAQLEDAIARLISPRQTAAE